MVKRIEAVLIKIVGSNNLEVCQPTGQVVAACFSGSYTTRSILLGQICNIEGLNREKTDYCYFDKSDPVTGGLQ